MNLYHTLSPSERPDSPVNVTTISAGPRWIAVRWTPTFDGNRPVLTFPLFIRNVNGNEGLVPVANLSTSDVMTTDNTVMYNVSNEGVVLPFTHYVLAVMSCNEIGCSEQSQESDVRLTLEDSES